MAMQQKKYYYKNPNKKVSLNLPEPTFKKYTQKATRKIYYTKATKDLRNFEKFPTYPTGIQGLSFGMFLVIFFNNEASIDCR
jgi:hypothetical protein